ncbi:unnamed protein product, partial [Rotaria sordida]
ASSFCSSSGAGCSSAGGLFSGVNDITAQAPAKVSLFSRYERRK